MFGILEEFIKKNGIKPKDCRYHTLRTVGSGKIRVLVLKDGIARTEYLCPDCSHHGYEEKEWKRPFSVKCSSCGKTIRVPRLKS